MALEEMSRRSGRHHKCDLTLLLLTNNLNLLIAAGVPGSTWGWEEVNSSLVGIEDKFWWCAIGTDRLSHSNGHVLAQLRPGLGS